MVHRKKSFSIFPSPAEMSLTKVSLGGNNLYLTSLFPPRESLVSDIPAGDGNIEKLFYGVCWWLCTRSILNCPLFFVIVYVCGRWRDPVCEWAASARPLSQRGHRRLQADPLRARHPPVWPPTSPQIRVSSYCTNWHKNAHFCCYITVDPATSVSQNGASYYVVFLKRARGWTMQFLNGNDRQKNPRSF